MPLIIDVGRCPETEDELWEFVRTIWNVRIPRTAVCPQHCAPFDAFADAFFARSTAAVWLGSRGLSGKSFLLATLAITEMVCLRANVSVIGGSGEQSVNVHRYLHRFWSQPLAPRHLLRTDPSKRETALVTGNVCRALQASQTSVRGPHPERLRLDEIDEMDRAIFDAALGQPMSRPPVRSHTVASSTHQYPDGTMTYALNLARDPDRNWRVWTWCFRESSNPVDGWLSADEVERTRRRVPESVWHTEYELQEPTIGTRAFNSDAVRAMFSPALGHATGAPNVPVEPLPPEPGRLYATGVDWGRDRDWSVIVTFRVGRTPAEPWDLAAFERVGRITWPAVIDRLNRRLARYPGAALHDETGVGKFAADYLAVPPGSVARGLWMQGQARADLFTSYIARVESGGFRCPMIDIAYTEHLYAPVSALYGTGHPPDTVVACALAWKARELCASAGGTLAARRRRPAPFGPHPVDPPVTDPRCA